jgi:hypothetical protein
VTVNQQLPNFSTYVVPGVYWESTPTPTAALPNVTASVVGLVGPGIGYETFTESDVLTGTDAVTLQALGIDIDSVVVTSLDGSTIYSPETDYTLTSVDSTDGNEQDTTTTLAAQVDSTITSGESVTVSYQYTDYAYGLPQLCSSLAQVQALYGVGIDASTGAILSPLSFAAQFAFDNGTSQVVCVATPNNPVLRADLTAAYELLGTVPSVNLVVPLPVGMTGTALVPDDIINVAQDLSMFCDQSQTEDDILRMGIIGFETTCSVGPDTIAEATLDARVVEAWPNAMNYYNGYINSTQVIGGYYLAAAYAGFLAAQYPQQGLTRQIITDFSGIPSSVFQTMTKAYKDQLSAAGVAVAEISRGGVLWCRHGVTTDNTSIYNQEISLVRSQDYMVELLEAAVEQSAIIGQPIGPDSIVNLQALTIGILESLVTLGVIEAYTSVTAVQLGSTPTDIQVTYQYQPSYPLNYVTFVFSVNTVTGNITAGTSTSSVSS